MFDIGWQELFIVGVLALLVVGPRDLPRTLRTVMGYVRKAKGMAREFRRDIRRFVPWMPYMRFNMHYLYHTIGPSMPS